MKKLRRAKKIGCKRRAAGWTLLALGLLVAGLWALSGWWTMYYVGSNLFTGFGSGAVVCNWQATGDRRIGPGLLFTKRGELLVREARYFWWEGFGHKEFPGVVTDDMVGIAYLRRQGEGLNKTVVIYIWPLPLLLWTPAALLLRSGIIAGGRRRAMSGLCKKCGYSLAGLPAGSPCPECGKGAGTK